LGRRRWEGAERQWEGRMWNRRGAADVHADGPAAGDGVMRAEDGDNTTIYVSMRDPIGRPAFKPSPTKPIPKWMQPFQSPVEDTSLAGHSDGLVALLAERLESLQQSHARKSECWSNGSTICPAEPSDRQDGESDGRGSSRLSESSHRSAYQSQWPSTHRGTSFVSVEPLKLPSSQLLERVTAKANLSSSTLNTYHTSLKYPSPSASFRTMRAESFSEIDYSVPRIRSVRRPTGASREDGAQNPLRKLGNMNKTPSRSSPQTHHVSHSAMPLTSSEYLERYQPEEAASMSAPSATRARGPVVAKPRKTSRAEPSAGQMADETAVADMRLRRAGSSTVVDPSQSQRTEQADGADPNTKRRSVRRFFGG
jgi:hypothetical protein